MIEAIKKRRSVRSYLSKPVEKEKVGEILRAAAFAPSANHLRPWQFIVVKDKEVKAKLSRATSWASFAARAPVVIVVCSSPSVSRQWLEDASIVGAHIYLEATNQDLGTCWIQVRDCRTPEGEKAEDYVRQLLEIPEEFRVVALFPLGYPAEKLAEHADDEFEEKKVHSERWAG